MHLAPDVYWRQEADCVLLSTPTGVVRLHDEWLGAWSELTHAAEDARAMSDLSTDAQALLSNLVEEGLVLLAPVRQSPVAPHVCAEVVPWSNKTLGHLDNNGPRPQPLQS
jgi:hypothetical protein